MRTCDYPENGPIGLLRLIADFVMVLVMVAGWRRRVVTAAAITTVVVLVLGGVAPAAMAVPSVAPTTKRSTRSSRAELVAARGGHIFAVAGDVDGKAGLGGNSGPATASALNGPTAVAVDDAGDVYIADSENNQVRKVDTSGNISIVAGSPTGLAGNTGDGGPAIDATLELPYGLAVDQAGNLYIADSGNSRIRMVNTAGVISNFAGNPNRMAGNGGDGGPAVDASLSEPIGLAVDRLGDVFVADNGNNRVREINLAGIISNVAGNPTGGDANTGLGDSGDGAPAIDADVHGPQGVAFDTAGNLYIAEDAGSVVRKVDVHGTISTFAGQVDTGASNSGDAGPATAARLLQPASVAVDQSGDVYIADSGDNRVRKVDGNDQITNFAGNFAALWGDTGDGGPAPAAELNEPTGLAIDASGDLYIADTGNNRVREVPAGPGAPGIASATITTFPVSTAGSFLLTAVATPTASFSETGALPAGVTFNSATNTLSGTPVQGTVGTYPITFIAANGIAPNASQSFTLIVDQAAFTYPTNGQSDVDTSKTFWWTSIPQAQGFIVTIGTSPFATNLYYRELDYTNAPEADVPALPAGITLYATLYTEVNGTWTSYQAITFTAASVVTTVFLFPTDGTTFADPTLPFSWTTTPLAQGYILLVGTTPRSDNLVLSPLLPPTQRGFDTPILPTSKELYATLLVDVDGIYSIAEASTFTTGLARGSLYNPGAPGQTIVTPNVFEWTQVAAAQNYLLSIGTAPYGANLLNSGVLPPATSFYKVPALPRGRTLYATLYTLVNGTWAYQEVPFIGG